MHEWYVIGAEIGVVFIIGGYWKCVIRVATNARMVCFQGDIGARKVSRRLLSPEIKNGSPFHRGIGIIDCVRPPAVYRMAW